MSIGFSCDSISKQLCVCVCVCVCVFESLYMCFGENKEGVLAALWNF